MGANEKKAGTSARRSYRVRRAHEYGTIWSETMIFLVVDGARGVCFSLLVFFFFFRYVGY